MYIYLDKQGVVKEIINEEALRQSASNVNEIYVYYDGLQESDIGSVLATYGLPDGTITDEMQVATQTQESEIPYNAERDLKYFQYYKAYAFYRFTIADLALSQEGIVRLMIRLAQKDGEYIKVAGLICFDVEGELVKEDHGVSLAQYNYLVKAWYETKECLPLDGSKAMQGNLDMGAHSVLLNGKTLKDKNGALNYNGKDLAKREDVSSLQSQIDTINATQNVVDIVGTKTELNAYETKDLHANDKIEVLTDESQNNANTIYEWNGNAWSLVGSKAPYYSKAESDVRYNELKAKSYDKDTTAYVTGHVPDSGMVKKSLDGISESVETLSLEAVKKNTDANLKSVTIPTASDLKTKDGSKIGALPSPWVIDATSLKVTTDVDDDTLGISNDGNFIRTYSADGVFFFHAPNLTDEEPFLVKCMGNGAAGSLHESEITIPPEFMMEDVTINLGDINTNKDEIATLKTKSYDKDAMLDDLTQGHVPDSNVVKGISVDVKAQKQMLDTIGDEVIKSIKKDTDASLKSLTLPSASDLKTKDGSSFGGGYNTQRIDVTTLLNQNDILSLIEALTGHLENPSFTFDFTFTNNINNPTADEIDLYLDLSTFGDTGFFDLFFVKGSNQDGLKYVSVYTSYSGNIIRYGGMSLTGSNNALTKIYGGAIVCADYALKTDLNAKQATLYRHTIEITKDNEASFILTTESTISTEINTMDKFISAFTGSELACMCALNDGNAWSIHYIGIQVGTTLNDTSMMSTNVLDTGMTFTDVFGTSGYTMVDKVKPL